jgi:hypothetical protein
MDCSRRLGLVLLMRGGVWLIMLIVGVIFLICFLLVRRLALALFSANSTSFEVTKCDGFHTDADESLDQPTQVGFSYSVPVPGFIDPATGLINELATPSFQAIQSSYNAGHIPSLTSRSPRIPPALQPQPSGRRFKD